MPDLKALRNPASIASFEVLVRRVQETFHSGRDRVRREMILTYWKTGRHIHRHLFRHRDRGDYGKKVISNLAERVEMSERSLQEMLKVYREFPKIPHARAEFGWTHLRKLATIPDRKLRDDFTRRVIQGHWSTDVLQAKIKVEVRGESEKGDTASKEAAANYSEIARPKLGRLYTYRLVRTPGDETLEIDQGFSIYKTEIDWRAKFKANDIAESKRSENGTYFAVKSRRTEEDLFTYKAVIERVIDGDTLFVKMDLGFTNSTRQYLRLREIDAPEMSESEGRVAKQFVTRRITAAPFIFLTSTRPDKYDRYLADVFIPGKEFLKAWKNGTAVLSKQEDLLYLNNEVLKHKHAIRWKD